VNGFNLEKGGAAEKNRGTVRVAKCCALDIVSLKVNREKNLTNSVGAIASKNGRSAWRWEGVKKSERVV